MSSHRPRRVLVIDDTRDIVEILECYLTSHGHRVFCAYGGDPNFIKEAMHLGACGVSATPHHLGRLKEMVESAVA